MKNKRISPRPLARIGLRVMSVISLAGVCSIHWSDSRAQVTPPTSDFHVISAGGNSLFNSCFRLSGTVGQAAPGYSSGTTDSIVAGFWSAAPTKELDEIFFNGFEGC